MAVFPLIRLSIYKSTSKYSEEESQCNSGASSLYSVQAFPKPLALPPPGRSQSFEEQ